MQTIILITHILGVVLSLYLYRVSRRWKYFALMLLLSNIIGVVFYIYSIALLPNRHDLSLYRSFAQALLAFIITVGLIAEGKDA